MCFKEAFLPCYSALSIEEPTYFSPQARLGLTGHKKSKIEMNEEACGAFEDLKKIFCNSQCNI